MKKKDTFYDIDHPDEIDSPALIIYPLRMKENILMLKSMIDDPERLRPHVKTHKTREATLMMMEAGIRKFKCATIAEAEMLGSVYAPDVLLAYQPSLPKIQRLLSLLKQYPVTRFSCLVDNAAVAANISAAAIKEKLVIRVYIDLNVGMNRTGIAPGKDAYELYSVCALLEGIRPVGLHFYDGHIREKDIELRRLACKELLVPVMQLKNDLSNAGYNLPQIIAGGSPTFPIYALEENIECSPGTFIFWDMGYQQALPEQHFLIAALVITRIISLPDKRKICLDLGYKSIASENELNNRVRFLNAPELQIISHSEEHMVLEAPEGHTWKVGDLLYALPIHICPTCALYETASIIKNGKITGNWKIIARDRKINC
ncbi:MAG: D-threonine aldolase [Ferruginibacter sp.]|nr:D-threonine aldolase [Ferruginibacter sp.]